MRELEVLDSGHLKLERAEGKAFFEEEMGEQVRGPISSFSNLESCERIVYGVVSHLNRSWERKPLKEFTQNA